MSANNFSSLFEDKSDQTFLVLALLDIPKLFLFGKCQKTWRDVDLFFSEFFFFFLQISSNSKAYVHLVAIRDRNPKGSTHVIHCKKQLSLILTKCM